MPVTTHHPDYDSNVSTYTFIRKIIANEASCYLDSPDPSDLVRTSIYRKYAVLVNATRMTLNGLVGLVFRKDPIYQLPQSIEYFSSDATGTGLSYDQLLVKGLSELISIGRFCILADFDGEEVPKDLRKVRIKPYCAEAVINFKYKNINGVQVPSLIVLEEREEVADNDPYKHNIVSVYRVLYLDENNVYRQRKLDKDGKYLSEIITPLDAKGVEFIGFIPFIFLGSENNNAEHDVPPLKDIALVNLGQYRNSADFEEMCYIVGQPTPVFNLGEGNAQQFKLENPSGGYLGARKGLLLHQGGSASLLQPNETQIQNIAQKEKLIHMAQLGARLIEPPTSSRETAEAAKIRNASQNSTLMIIVKNFEEGMEWITNIALGFHDVSGTEMFSLNLNTEFYEPSADPNLIAQMWVGVSNRIFDSSIVLDYLRRCGIINENDTNEDIISRAMRNNLQSPIDSNNKDMVNN